MIIGFLILYVLSGIAWYLSVKYDYKHNHPNSEPFWNEVVIVFIPFINTGFSICAWMLHLWMAIDEKVRLDPKFTPAEFFRIKR